jgi:Tfp pilus assembly protein PilF
MTRPGAFRVIPALLAVLCLPFAPDVQAQASKSAKASKQASAPAAAPSFQKLIESANDELAQDDVHAGLASARRAVAAVPSNYRGHFLVAMALYKMEEWDQAETAVQTSLRLAPTDLKEGVRKLAQLISWGRAGLMAAIEAEAAQKEGLFGKAATTWKTAWEAGGYQRPAHAIAAADIYNNKLGEPVKAAQLLREVLERERDIMPEDAETARRHLKAISPKLERLAATQFAAALKAKEPEQSALLKEVLETDPDYAPAYELQATAAAQRGDIDALKRVLKELSRRERLSLAFLRTEPILEQTRLAEFKSWMVDLVGTARGQTLEADLVALDARKAAQAAYQQAMRDYDAAVLDYRARLGEYYKLAPCLRNADSAYASCNAKVPKLDTGILGLGGNEKERLAMFDACNRTQAQEAATCRASYPAYPPTEPKRPVAPAVKTP